MARSFFLALFSSLSLWTSVLTIHPSQAAAFSSTFSGFQGAWSGSGDISLSDGSRERIRCKATYRTSEGGTRLQQTLRCAGDSYRVDLNSDLTSVDGRVTGSWSESGRGVSGSIAGHEVGGSITAVADAPGFTANLSLSTRGNHQTFLLSSQGDIRSVSLTMVRR
ncbi:hypothetical protein FNJ47_33790 [Bradyrhizobium sp. UFLA 03-164]|uniref:Lipocalin-like domain-containing protein n=1 Tax=Bradyrhizobium uaiense TaxID=2594946 RepID=A0A6P1BR30_9BRAD|nr:hypothetical protein [Bradyrhizobium uaiense]